MKEMKMLYKELHKTVPLLFEKITTSHLRCIWPCLLNRTVAKIESMRYNVLQHLIHKTLKQKLKKYNKMTEQWSIPDSYKEFIKMANIKDDLMDDLVIAGIPFWDHLQHDDPWLIKAVTDSYLNNKTMRNRFI